MIVSRALRAIADRQAGYFSAAQARRAGYPNDLQRYHYLHGNWLMIERAIFRLPGYLDSRESSFIRWSLWAEGQSRRRMVAISHESALHYYGLQAEPPQATHLIVTSLRRQHEHPECVLHLDRLERGEFQTLTGFSILTPQRTLEVMRPDLLYAARWESTLRLAKSRGLIEESALRTLSGMESGDDRSVPRIALPAPVEQPAQAQTEPAGRPDREGTAMMSVAGPISRQLRGRYPEWLVPGRAFTLVEMLVVISIICVLAGMLLPALNKALSSSRAAACVNNLRQMGTALTMYSDSGDGRYPYCIDNSNTIWVTKICPYAGMTWTSAVVDRGMQGIFNCPENSQQLYITSTGPSIDETRASYGINGFSTQAFIEANPGLLYNNPAGLNSRRFTHPADLRVVTDNQYYRLDYGQLNGLGDGANCVPVTYGIGPRNMRYVHNLGANFLYADGHAGFVNGPVEDRGAFQGTVGGINKYVNGRMWFAVYPF